MSDADRIVYEESREVTEVEWQRLLAMKPEFANFKAHTAQKKMLLSKEPEVLFGGYRMRTV